MEIKSLIVDMRKRLTKKNRRILKKIVEPKTWIVHTYLSLINFLSFDEGISFCFVFCINISCNMFFKNGNSIEDRLKDGIASVFFGEKKKRN